MSNNKRKPLNSQVTPSQMSEILRHMIANNVELARRGRTETVSVNIEGEAGIGKTSICKQIAREFDHHFVRLNLAEIETPDYKKY